MFPFFFWALFTMFHLNKIGQFMANFEWVYLAIDVPRDNVQSPRAVENIFSHLAGGHGTMDLAEKYYGGHYQRWFSFEIISIEGYIQFVIRTEVKFRDLVEAAIYAQYPEAEITEIDDYSVDIPSTYPNDTHDCWGAEWTLVMDDEYPIRTYMDFEDKSVKDDVFKDPMAALLETFSRIGKGEQLWLQILVQPMGQTWKKKGFDKAKELMGKPEKPKRTWLHWVGDIPIVILRALGEAFGVELFPDDDSPEERVSFGMFALSPNERDLIEGIERKVSKIGFKCKMRGVYVAEKERFNKNHVMYGLVGAIKQFAHEGQNSLKPEYAMTGTTGHYIFIETKKNIRRTKIMQGYKSRSMWWGIHAFILNTEELATLWHFPVMSVKTPLLATTVARRSQPPGILPSEIPFQDAPGGKPLPRKISKDSQIATDAGVLRKVGPPKDMTVPPEHTTPIPVIVADEESSTLGAPPPNLPLT